MCGKAHCKQNSPPIIEGCFISAEGSYDLEDIELQIIRLRNVPEYWVIGSLLARLDLPQLNIRVLRRRAQR